ncbi:MAG: hypothetical protein Q8T08_17730, partial [Ignavibacteria bacterium]|nr:hypothetical protein [Ignavibacteria bacterium]
MKKNVLVKNFSILVLMLFTGFMLKAQPIVVENFDYPVGSLLSANGYTSHSGTANFIAVTAPTINYAGYASSGIGNEVSLVNTGEDVHKTFTPPTASVVYASFLVNVTSASTTGDYFFHLGQTTLGTTYRGRIFVMKDASEKIAFGISQSANNSTTPGPNYSPFIYDVNTTYLIVLKFNIVAGESNDFSSIYINPTIGAPEPSTGWVTNIDASSSDLTEVGAFALRQGGSASGPYLKIDGIRIATAWSDIVGGASAPSIAASPNTLNGFTYVAGSGP